MPDPSGNGRPDNPSPAHTTDQSVDSPGADDAALIGLWLQLGFPDVERQADRVDGWVVDEFSVGIGGRHYDLDALDDLLEGMSEWQPTASYNHDGYAVQLHIPAPTVHLGPAPPGPDTVTAALGIGRRSEMYASGSTDTVAGLMVGPWLPRLRADAW